jgi:alpha-D-ribose 1-methylphosphonate 5-triphosphate synthase subunit PhnH
MTVRPGFGDPILDGQRVFRAVLTAMAHPGRVVDIQSSLECPPPLGVAATATCLALLDFETPLWLDDAARTPAVTGYLRFHCGVPLVEAPAEACFALAADGARLPALDAFIAGTVERPDRSATVIVQAKALDGGAGWQLTGPGIATASRLAVRGLPPHFPAELRANRARFPRGVDVILTAGGRLAALPRTTQVDD